MSITIKKAEFEQLINEFDREIENIKKIYSDIEEKAERLNGLDDMWKGKTQEKVYEYYYDISNDFPNNIERFESLSNYLKNTLQNYTDEEKGLNEDIDFNSKDLNINE